MLNSQAWISTLPVHVYILAGEYPGQSYVVVEQNGEREDAELLAEEAELLFFKSKFHNLDLED